MLIVNLTRFSSFNLIYALLIPNTKRLYGVSTVASCRLAYCNAVMFIAFRWNRNPDVILDVYVCRISLYIACMADLNCEKRHFVVLRFLAGSTAGG